jgi:hypothetical protein
VPVGFTLKYCKSADGSVCSSIKWTNCLAPANPLPPTVTVSGGLRWYLVRVRVAELVELFL